MTREELDRLETEAAELERQGHREARRDVVASHFHALLAAARERDEQVAELARLRTELERAQNEWSRERARADNTVKLLAGIYALMYPSPVKTCDGRTMVFRPNSPDPHEMLQELSDRIRALRDALAQEPPA